MKKEIKNSDLALYCKQGTVESWNELPWACGFASIATAFRFLGDRETEAHLLPSKFKRMGGKPSDGLCTDELIKLIRAFDYKVKSFSDKYDSDSFKKWLASAWMRNHPTIVAVCSSSDDHDHYIVAYSNPDDQGVWVMDPLEENEVYEYYSWKDFLDYSSNQSEDYCFWEAHEIIPSAKRCNMTPPSTALFDWINDLPGEVEYRDFLAVALLDNFFNLIEDNKARSGGVKLSKILADDGELWNKLMEWEAYYDVNDIEMFGEMHSVLQDIDAHLDIKLRANEIDYVVGELALLLVHSWQLWRELE